MLFIIKSLKHGDLSGLINQTKNSNTNFSDKQIFNWTLDSANALKYLHANKIIHRNIKPSNMLLTRQNRIKLGDFVFAKYLENDFTDVYTGSPVYMSPEQFRSLYDNISYTYNADIW